MSLNSLEHGDRRKAVKKSARKAIAKVFKFIQKAVSDGELESEQMAKASSDYVTTYSSSDTKQLNMIARAYA